MRQALKSFIIGLLIAVIIIAIIGGVLYIVSKRKHGSTQLKNQTERFTTSNAPWNTAIDQFVYDYVTSELGEQP